MSVSKTIAGTAYLIPERNEKRWGAQATAFLSKLADVAILLVGGTGGTPVPAYTAASTSLAAGATLTPTAELHRIQGDSAARTLSTVTPITAGVDGQRLVLEGVHATNTITIQDGGTVDLNGDIVLTLGEMLELVYNTSRALWVEKTRSA